jgi:hypothetical protein
MAQAVFPRPPSVSSLMRLDGPGGDGLRVERLAAFVGAQLRLQQFRAVEGDRAIG